MLYTVGMNKRKLHHVLVRLQSVPLWLFLGLTLLFGITAVFSLRANNQQMIELRQAVLDADEQDGDIEGTLNELREYVYTHMNTNLSAGNNPIKPPIQLKHHYERLQKAEQARVGATNEKLLNDAQNYCEKLFPGGVGDDGTVPCIKEFMEIRGAKFKEIPKEAYMFDFVSPSWSPDLAGWSLVVAFLSSVLFLLHLGSEWIIRNMLRKEA